MKKLKLPKSISILSFAFTMLCLVSISSATTPVKFTLKPSRALKVSTWLNYPYAINGQKSISFCTDVVDESTIIPQGMIHDGDRICQWQTYRLTLPFNCASVTWGMYNAYVFYSYSNYDKVFKFDSNIFVDGWASIWVTVIDPVTSDSYFYELSVTPWEECED